MGIMSITKTRRSGIFVGTLSFLENDYDRVILKSQLVYTVMVIGTHKPQADIFNRGKRGRKWVGETRVVIPGKLPASASNYQKHKTKKQFRARAGIEPVIGHLKHNHRMS